MMITGSRSTHFYFFLHFCVVISSRKAVFCSKRNWNNWTFPTKLWSHRELRESRQYTWVPSLIARNGSKERARDKSWIKNYHQVIILWNFLLSRVPSNAIWIFNERKRYSLTAVQFNWSAPSWSKKSASNKLQSINTSFLMILHILHCSHSIKAHF